MKIFKLSKVHVGADVHHLSVTWVPTSTIFGTDVFYSIVINSIKFIGAPLFVSTFFTFNPFRSTMCTLTKPGFLQLIDFLYA